MKEIEPSFQSTARLIDLGSGGQILENNVASWVPRNHRSYAYAGCKILSYSCNIFNSITTADYLLAKGVFFPKRVLPDGTFSLTLKPTFSTTGGLPSGSDFILTLYSDDVLLSPTITGDMASGFTYTFTATPTRGITYTLEYQPDNGVTTLTHVLLKERVLTTGDL